MLVLLLILNHPQRPMVKLMPKLLLLIFVLLAPRVFQALQALQVLQALYVLTTFILLVQLEQFKVIKLRQLRLVHVLPAQLQAVPVIIPFSSFTPSPLLQLRFSLQVLRHLVI